MLSVSAAVATPPPLELCSSVPMDLLCAQGRSRARHVSSWLARRSASPGTRTAISPAARPSARRPAKPVDSSGAGAAGRLAASKAPFAYPLGRGGERRSGGDDGARHGGDHEQRGDGHHAARGAARRGERLVRADPGGGHQHGPRREQPAADVEQRLGGLVALLGGGEGDQGGQHGAESYRTEGRPSYRDSVAATWPW